MGGLSPWAKECQDNYSKWSLYTCSRYLKPIISTWSGCVVRGKGKTWMPWTEIPFLCCTPCDSQSSHKLPFLLFAYQLYYFIFFFFAEAQNIFQTRNITLHVIFLLNNNCVKLFNLLFHHFTCLLILIEFKFKLYVGMSENFLSLLMIFLSKLYSLNINKTANINELSQIIK